MFKRFGMQLGPFVVRALNKAFEDVELSTTQKEDITCIPKGDKPRDNIKNRRQISLLNVIYKIGSFCIANRIQRVLASLTDGDQTGFISSRYMGDKVRLIYDLINYLNTNKQTNKKQKKEEEEEEDCCCAETLRKRLTLLMDGLIERLVWEKMNRYFL